MINTRETLLSSTLEEAISGKVASGISVAFGSQSSGTLYRGFSADTSYTNARPITRKTIWDIASLTKAIVIPTLFGRLIDDSRVSLDDPLKKYIPEMRSEYSDAIRIGHALGHAAGFPAHIPFYTKLESLSPKDARKQMFLDIAGTTLAHRPGTKTLYSDLGYMLMGCAAERIFDRDLDEIVQTKILDPLNMQYTGYSEANSIKQSTEPIASTEILEDGTLLTGIVHDENARCVGGVMGHAGLFATIDDIKTFCQQLLAQTAGRPSNFPVSKRTITTLVQTSAAPNTTWKLGWDSPSPLPVLSHAGDLWPRSGIGHLGFTGCSMWLDLRANNYAIVLSNRVLYSRESGPIRTTRRNIMDTIASQLGYQKATSPTA